MYAADSHPSTSQHHGLAPPFVQDSPYLTTSHAPSAQPRESHFDPHDPAWFTPQFASSSSSQFVQGAFDYGHGDGGGLDEDEDQEVLAFVNASMESAYEASSYRRYSEGDRPASGTSDRHPYSMLQSAQGYRESTTTLPTFDGYTLAPPVPPSAAPSALFSQGQLASGEVSPSSASFPRMTQEPWRPRAAQAYEQDYAPQELVDHTSYSHYDAHSAAPYSASTSLAPSAFPYELSSSSRSSAARSVAQPTAQHVMQHSALAYPSFTSSAPDTPLASPLVGYASPRQPGAPSSSGQRPLRPGLVRAHTNASPESASQPQFYPATVAPGSVPRHNSWSSPDQAGHFQQHDDTSRRLSVQAASPVAFAPYPSSATRRRSSQAALQQAAGSPARGPGVSWTPTSSRRSSGVPVGAQASGVVRSSRHVDDGGCDNFTQGSPFEPVTPTSRRTSHAVEVVSGSLPHPHASSPAFSFAGRRPHTNLFISVDASPSRRSSTATSGMGPYRSPYYSPFSPSSPYANSAVNTPATVASGCSSAFYPPEQYSPAMVSSAGASVRDPHGRRHTDPYGGALPSTGAFHASTRRSQEAMRRASAAAAAPAPTTMAGSSLASFAGHSPGPLPPHGAYAPEQAYASANEGMTWTGPAMVSNEWAVMAPSGLLDVAAGGGLPLDGTVGLGLEMSMEEVRLSTAATTGIAPETMYTEAVGLPEPYDAMGVLQAQQEAAYQDLLVAESRALARRDDGRWERVQGEIRSYLAAENGMALGEKTVVVMSPKIAQRSYGTEKRLLAPPPTALLLGSSWWSTHASSSALSLVSGKLPTPDQASQRLTLPPEIFLSISTDKLFPRVSASAQWIADDGKLVLERDEEDSAPLAGRAMSKSLAVNVEGELNKDTSTTVSTVVTICEPGEGDVEPRVWARFLGKPISVISKPSKKKAIVSGNLAGLCHGSLVSVYNRTKMYSGSTRYLCTSGVASMFPTQQWASMTGGSAQRTFAPDSRDVRLVSKTSVWDAFVVYAANIDSEPGRQSSVTPQPGFPPPPSNALPVDAKIQRSLYYNQTVVLQDLATGVVSPILVLRRVDAGNVSVGGGSRESVVPPPPNDPSLYPTPPGEQLGEPVSQYKPIALEVAQRSPAAQHPGDRDPTRDTYLGVVDDEVGMYGIDDPRTWVRPASEQAAVPITPTTPVGGAFGGPQQRADELGEYDLSRADPLAKPGPRTSARPRASRRTSAETAKLTSPAVKNKRRGMTAAALAELTAAAEREVRGGAAGLWTLPLGEGHVWSIAQVEVERHTFFVPPSLDSKKVPFSVDLREPNPSYRTPRPRIPIGPQIPAVFSVEGPLPSTTREGEAGTLVVKGRYLSPDLAVWIGDSPCPQVHFRSSEHIVVRPPLAVLKRPRSRRDDEPGHAAATGIDKSRRIALVRPDGVVFPTQVWC